MAEKELLDMLLDHIECRDCPVAHAAAGPSKCPFRDSDTKAEAVIYSESEPADRAWFVRSGAVTLGQASSEDASLALPGQIIGLDCLVGDTRLGEARAALPTQLCAITKDELVAWLGNDKQRLRLVLDAAMADPRLAAALDKL